MESLIERRIEEWQGESYDEDTRSEIRALVSAGDEKELVDRFYQDLDFGTGGLRGVMGAGTNRMNVYTVRRATQGLAEYLLAHGGADAARRGAVVACDARRNSDLFAHEVARVFAGNGIRVHLFESLRPTPELSFAVRHLHALVGVNVTASHNPPEYNGYKAYWEDGAQMTPPHDTGVIAEVRKVTSNEQVKLADEAEARAAGLIVTIGTEVDEAYYARILELSLSRDLVEKHGAATKVVYTPLHGAGYLAVPEMLRRFGFTAVTVVPEQAKPDGNFPTIKAPNPEVQASMQLALDLAAKVKADLVLGTDADSDRLGVAVPVAEGQFRLLSGNQIGVVLVDYYLRALERRGKLPKNGVVVKTIVTTELQRVIAESHGVACIDVLTGFKWIGKKMLEWEEARAAGSEWLQYLVGGEESFGFLAGDFVRDKDAVIAACLLAEAAVDCRSRGQSLFDRLDAIYLEHGLYLDELANVFHEGKEGAEKIQAIMRGLREGPPTTVGGSKVVERWDVKSGRVDRSDGSISGPLDLPSSDVLVFFLENGCKVTARPSGTEPKIKFYVAIRVPPSTEKGPAALEAMRAEGRRLAKATVSDFMAHVGRLG